MIYDYGSSSVSMSDNGGALSTSQIARCRYRDATIIDPWVCSNYVVARFSPDDGSWGGIPLGESRIGHYFHYHAAQNTVNEPPGTYGSYPNFTDYSCGSGGGSMEDAPYHPEGDITNKYATISWNSFGGNFNDPMTLNCSDDKGFRVFDITNPYAYSQPIWHLPGTRQTVISGIYRNMFDEWGGKCINIEGTDIITCGWIGRWEGFPNTATLWVSLGQ